MDENQFRWKLELPEVITVQEVKKTYPHLDEQYFAELVLDLIIGTAEDDVHFASYLAGYLNAVQLIKSTYAKAPLEFLEALDAGCNCDD